MLSTFNLLDWHSGALQQSVQWTVEAPYNEFYRDRIICLLEEHRCQRGDELWQTATFSLWNVDQGISARKLGDEEKSSLFNIFGWLPVVLRMRCASETIPLHLAEREPFNFTWVQPVPPLVMDSFFAWSNYLLKGAPRALFSPAKIALLQLVERAAESQPHWSAFFERLDDLPQMEPWGEEE